MIWPDEAERLAQRLVAYRQAGPMDWRRFYEILLAESETLFVRDSLDLGDGNGNGDWDDDDNGDADVNPIAVRNWTQAKADLAFQTLAIDILETDMRNTVFNALVRGVPTAWAGWGLQEACRAPASRGARAHQPAGLTDPNYLKGSDPSGTLDPSYPYRQYQEGFAGLSSDRLMPLGGTLAPRSGSSGSARRSGRRAARFPLRRRRFHSGERLELATQEDFEGLARASWPRAGSRSRLRRSRRRGRATIGAPTPTPTYSHAATLPRPDRRSLTLAPEGNYYHGRPMSGPWPWGPGDGDPGRACHWAFAEIDNAVSPMSNPMAWTPGLSAS